MFPTAGARSLELTLAVFNLMHLLNADWGLIRGVDFGGSRWRMQLGARVTC